MTRWTVFILGLISALLLTAPLIAQEEIAQEKIAQEKTAQEKVDLEALRAERAEKRKRYHLRALTQKRMNAASELFESEQYAKARVDLEKLNPNRLNAYERALVYKLLAYAATGQEDSRAAIDYFQKVVDEQVLPLEDEISVLFSIAQIYASFEEWEKVDETLREWFRLEERPNGAAYYLLAISHYERDQYDEALAPALKAIEVSTRSEERWLQLVAALHLEKEDFDSAVPILEELVTRFPRKLYWTQLSLIYGARGDYEHSLRVQQLAYAQGLPFDHAGGNLLEGGEGAVISLFRYLDLFQASACHFHGDLDRTQIAHALACVDAISQRARQIPLLHIGQQSIENAPGSLPGPVLVHVPP